MAGRRPHRFGAALALTIVLATLAVFPTTSAAGGEPGTAEEQLAERYAPVLMLQEQEHECDPDGEPYTPASVEAVLGNPQVALRQVGNDDPVVMWGPTAQDLFGLRRGFYLDFPGLALAPGCVYERDNRDFTGDLPPTVYAHVVVQPEHPDRLILQYWIWWYYNGWNNKHEGDWEGIQIVFPAATAEEALGVEPIEVGYSQHEGGERADWTDAKLERDGPRPVVYASAGSHASYFGAALYLGRNGSEGFGCDDTGGAAVRIDPEVVVLPTSVDDPDSDLAWLGFLGLWGERGEGPYSGPTGPADKGRWINAIDRQERLRDGSVVVPGGDGRGAAIADLFCDVIGWGSEQVVAIKLQPLRGAILGAVGVALAAWAIRSTSWRQVEPLPIVRRRRFGEIVRAAGRIFAKRPVAYVLIGLAAMPFSVLVGLLAGAARAIPLVGDLIELTGAGLGAALVLSGLSSLLAFVAIVALVAWVTGEAEAGREATFRAAARALWERAGDLAGALVRAVLIVSVLSLSIVGVPWALRQVFRYQFLGQTTMLEDRGGAAALRRSTELVRRRWWHTATVTTLVTGSVAVIAATVGLVLLIVARPPFWTLSAIVVLVEVLAFPFAAIVMTLVYGDAVHETDSIGGDLPVPGRPAG